LPTGVSAPPQAVSEFTGWSQAISPSRVHLSGVGLTAAYTAGSTGAGYSWTAPAPDSADLTVARYSNGGLASLSMTMGGRSATATFAAHSPAQPDCCLVPFNGLNLTRLGSYDLDANWSIFAVDTAAAGQNYQTYGTWGAGDADGPNGIFSGFSVGAATPAASVPAAGSAQFTGSLYGEAWFGDGAGNGEIASTVSINVNFASRSAVFASADWTRYNDQVVAGTALSGVLTYAAGTNALSGTLTTANGSLSGPAVGQFYGPAAEELGGAFSLTSTTTSQDHVVGGFGAKR
jgi:hypothetical protein